MQKIKAIKLNKKRLLIIVASIVVVIALLTGLAIWLKQSAESGAKTSIEKSRVSAGSAIKTLNTKLLDPKLPAKDRLETFSQLDQTLQKISTDTCSAESKNILYALSTAKNTCDTARKEISAIRTAAQKIQQSTKDDQAFSAALAPIQSADVASPSKQLEAWNTVATNIAKANVSQDATNLKNQLLAAAIGYRSAWQELINADKAQNKANYNTAVKKLDTAKEELAKAAISQTNEFKARLTDFKKAVESFKK